MANLTEKRPFQNFFFLSKKKKFSRIFQAQMAFFDLLLPPHPHNSFSTIFGGIGFFGARGGVEEEVWKFPFWASLFFQSWESVPARGSNWQSLPVDNSNEDGSVARWEVWQFIAKEVHRADCLLDDPDNSAYGSRHPFRVCL